MPAPPVRSRFEWLRTGIYLAIALAFRGGELWRQSENLLDDRDAYLAIAKNLAEGHGFASSADAPPSAFRPPLYPCLLAVGIRAFGIETDDGLRVWVGGLNLVLSLLTILLTIRLARRWFGEVSAAVCWIWLCFDPLLVHNVTLPMTETLFTFLLMALFNTFDEPEWNGTEPAEPSRRRQVLQGLVFGLCALCRPTIWVFGGLWGAWNVAKIWRRAGISGALQRGFIPAITTLAIMLPWIVRNALVFGAFIPMTTHGGYTLLLANNPVFHEEVVSQSWRNVWTGESLQAWQNDLDVRMAAEGIAENDEMSRDRWMSRTAREFIQSHPRAFLQGCVARFLRFWNVVPLETGSGPPSRLVSLILLTFFSGLFGSVLLAVKLRPDLSLRMFPMWVAILSFTAVHTVYWSNLRMRAPLEPLLAVLAVASLGVRRRRQPLPETLDLEIDRSL